VRVTIHVIGVEADFAQQLRHALAPRFLRARAVNHQRLAHDVAHFETRIQTRVRVLKDDLHLGAHVPQSFA
jgi:hypothetical protein